MDIVNYIVASLHIREEKIMNAQFYKVIEIYEKIYPFVISQGSIMNFVEIF